MADSDALLVVQDWISEHFFTTDSSKESFLGRTLDRVKEWKAAEHPTTKSRFTGERVRLAAALANLYADDDSTKSTNAEAVHDDLRRILGYDGGPFTTTTEGPVRFVATPGEQRAALAIIDARPVDALDDLFAKHGDTLSQPFEGPDGENIFSASRLVSTLFLAEEAPSFALVLAGRWLVVAEASRWPEGRYLAVDIQTVAERGDLKQGGEVDRALTCVDAASLAPDADGDVWWAATLEASVRHTVGVSADLREGVRESIELIANQVVTRRRDRGWDPLRQDKAQPLALQSLRFLYRILFLLYAEASPELAVLPVGDPDYDNGYSLDRLRELIQTELATPSARNGTHLYESLALLFRLVDRGHRLNTAPSRHVAERGLEFEPLRADLFKSEATALIDESGLGNDVMQRVLRRLLLSKEARGKERGFISYVELGINQLGAVYEGLMSYSGSFADVDLYEVAHDGNPEKGSWVVPQDRADHLDEKDFVVDVDELTGQRSRRRYSKGEFVFRLSGRERQRSASYYTPEVLTKFTVSQALAELLDQDDTITSADDILTFSVCEPALGSGAFAIEATRQLADEYLRRKQDELGVRIEPEDYPQELQRTKAFIAIHNVYGVDLNATAVEFAEITLWLDTMAKGLAAPWFGLRLRRGNSLVGASRSFYSRAQINDKSWLTTPPTDEPLADLADKVARDEQTLSGANGRIHHFLLPAAGWGSTADAKEAKQLAPDRSNAVRQWRRKVVAKPTKKQLDTLAGIAAQADELWGMAYKRLLVAEQESARNIPLFGQTDLFPEQPRDEGAGRVEGPPSPAPTPHVTREQIEDSLADPNGAYQRLRRVMDAWCALWFWPLTGDDVEPPTLDQWIDAAAKLLGNKSATKSRKSEDFLRASNAWEALAEEEEFTLAATGAKKVAEVLDANPWLRVCEAVSATQGFFHWQLDFATVFGRGGFDLQVGNPPWVRPRGDVDALLAESDPWWQLALKPSTAERNAQRQVTLTVPGVTNEVVDGTSEVVALAAFVGDVTTYPHLVGLQPDLYRCFMSQTWRNTSERGATGLIHPESHFTDEKAGHLRRSTYSRLRRHWQFGNDLLLFSEIDNHVSYGVHVYARERLDPIFLNASSLYHPDTVLRSLKHDGVGEEPGHKHEGKWDQRAHASRVQRVTNEMLSIWRDLLESPEVAITQSRMLYTVNRSSAVVLAKLSSSARVSSRDFEFSRGWDESIDRQKGRFIQLWGPTDSWRDVILQGPHFFVDNPFNKHPRSTMKSNKDWSSVDLESLAPDALPVTSYKPAGDRVTYDSNYGNWNGVPVRDYYRISWRRMAANSGERTMIPALIPPGAAHVHPVYSTGGTDALSLILALGSLSSLLTDFQIRSSPKSDIHMSTLSRLALPPLSHPLIPRLLLRTVRLNCLTDAYADLWAEVWDPAFVEDEWLLDSGYPDAPRLGDVGPLWTPEVPLRRDIDRRNALLEIDALMATMLGITADELSTIYRTQFAVLHGYDQNAYIFDANGRIVPTSILQVWRRKGDKLTEEERTATHPAGTVYTYELPFAPRDREAGFHVVMPLL